MQHIKDRMKFGAALAVLALLLSVIVSLFSCRNDDQNVSSELSLKQKHAISLYAETKTNAFSKGILSKDEMLNTDALWTNLLIRNPDSALEYATYLSVMVENGNLKKWPSLEKKWNQSFIDSQSVVAFGLIQFGMTNSEYEKLPHSETKYIQKIGEYDYMISPLFDNNDKIYMIQIKSFTFSANYLDNKIKDYALNLGDIISKKYIDYEENINSFPSILSLEPNKINFFEKWRIGQKVIKIGIGEVESGSEYYVCCWIYHDAMYNSYHSYNDNKIESKKSTDAAKF